MDTKSITISVSAEAARVYEEASAEQQHKLNILLDLKLAEVAQGGRSLEAIMDEMSRNAEARGLTSERLDGLLNDE